MQKVKIKYNRGLVVTSTTDEDEVLVSIPRSVNFIGFFHKNFLISSHGARILARLMAIGSPAITWDIHITGNVCVLGPNTSGITGAMLC